VRPTLEDLVGRSRRRTLPPAADRILIRLRSNLSQQDLADYLGVSRVAISRWESDERHPRRPHLERYTELLDRLSREVFSSD
jgi:HTH-type transcriptional regulator/antitoxin MqsA